MFELSCAIGLIVAGILMQLHQRKADKRSRLSLSWKANELPEHEKEARRFQ